MADRTIEPYADQADVEARLSPRTVKRILEDNNDGDVSFDAVNQAIIDGQALVDGRLKGIYSPVPVNKDGGAVPEEVKRLTLDAIHAYLAIRHPEYVRVDGMKMMEMVKKELKELREGDARLDTDGAPETGAQTDGLVEPHPSLDDDDDGIPRRMFRDTGIY
jgi:phage gp36-like protein